MRCNAALRQFRFVRYETGIVSKLHLLFESNPEDVTIYSVYNALDEGEFRLLYERTRGRENILEIRYLGRAALTTDVSGRERQLE